ncbi:DUF4399 domain-containing protein [Gilvimarinus polysaccharolyticus]|uniref:DUF4399 domain-containing protein n=1 Tax=Gilvimarinus polysaccharolyticus TaxID=863921 RepID=UPI00067323CA|nr:DUF4399 domain-containing protein [Gilvimarinus polysaccharolyticus]
MKLPNLKTQLIGLSLASTLLCSTVLAAEPSVYIIAPADGASVSNPVTVKFGLSGMGVAPAGVERDNTGHHHLLIDVKEMPDLTQPIAADQNHIHFGGGQTETTLELAPGEHTLQLLLGDYLHRPHSSPVMSDKITITVK